MKNNLARLLTITLVLIALCTGMLLSLPVNASPLRDPTNPGTTNLIAWWQLDETSGTRDDVHGSNDLSDNNTVTFGTGIKNNAALLTAVNNESLSITDNASLSVGNVDFTICTWANLASEPGSYAIMVGKYTGSSANREYMLRYIGGATDRFRFGVSPDGTDATPLTEINANSFGAMTTSTWNFVCAWYDANGDTVNIQVNNGTVDSTAHATGIFDGTAAFFLGTNGGGVGYWDGMLDETFIYKDVLSSDERTWLYNSGIGRSYCEITEVCATPTATNTPTDTPTNTATNTPTDTPTSTPDPCSLAGVLTSSTWNNSAGTSADVCTDNNVYMVWDEPADEEDTTVLADFTSVNAVDYQMTFNGHYTGAHDISIDCFDGYGWVNLGALHAGITSDEDIFVPLPGSCNDGSLTVRFYHASAGNATDELYIDRMIIQAREMPGASFSGTITYGDTGSIALLSVILMVIILFFISWLVVTFLQRRRKG